MIKILSRIDVITNSSSECFIVRADNKSEDEIYELIKEWISKHEPLYYDDGEPIMDLCPDCIEKLSDSDNLYEIRWTVMCNLNDPEEMLKYLFGDNNVKYNG